MTPAPTLVERLREAAKDYVLSEASLFIESADEIERLKEIVNVRTDSVMDLADERLDRAERLQASEARCEKLAGALRTILGHSDQSCTASMKYRVINAPWLSAEIREALASCGLADQGGGT